jgi:uncharacterized protein YggE
MHLFTRTLVLVLTFGAVADLRAQSSEEHPRITVNGDAVVTVRPDRVVLSFGIESSDPHILVAKQKNSDIQARVITALTNAGIQEKDLQTDHLSIEPRWEDSYRKLTLLGYFARNTVVVTLSDPAAVEDIVTKALQAGVTAIHGIDFQTTAFAQSREQARELALRAALEKARHMAATLGQTVGPPLSIHENPTGSSWWYPSGWRTSGFGQGMTQNVVQNAAPEGSDTVGMIALGRISVRASVTVTFELRR